MECWSPFVFVVPIEIVLLLVVDAMSLLLFDVITDPSADRDWIGKSVIIDFLELVSALCNVSGGKLNAGNENPAAAAACKDCISAAECSWALRRNSATDVVRGSFDDDVDTLLAFVIVVERLAVNDGIDDVADDVIVGQHEHNPGNPEQNRYAKIKF